MSPPKMSRSWRPFWNRGNDRLRPLPRSEKTRKQGSRSLSPPYLLDANAISDAMKGQPNLVAKAAAQRGSLVTSVIVKGEIRYGLDILPFGKRRTDLEAKA